MSGGVLEVMSRGESVVAGLMAAAFLALYWVLRGAPLGQAAAAETDAEAPPAGYRDRVAAAAVGGLLLVALGGLVAVGYGIPWSLPLFAVGFGIVLATIRLNRRYRHASPTLRRVVQFSDAVLVGALLAGVLIVGNVLAFRYGSRPLDLTRERAYTLESLTVNQLRGLKKPVTFTVFSGEGARAAPQLGRIEQLLDLFRAENPAQVRIRRINPYTDPAFEALARQVPDVAVAVRQGGGVIVELGAGETAERVVVRNSEMFDAVPASPYDPETGRFESSFHGEDALASALIRLREGKRPRIGLTTGHGEPPSDELDPNRQGLGLLKARLTAVGADVFELPLVRDEVPKGTEVVIVAAPRTPLPAEQLARLETYMRQGGRLLVFLDNEGPTGLEDWLTTYHVAAGPGLIVDPRYNTGRRPELPVAPVAGDVAHPIVAPLRNQGVIVPRASPLTATPGTAGNDALSSSGTNTVAVPILKTSPFSWAESDPTDPNLRRDPGRDTPGPLTVGLAVADRPPAEAGPAAEGTPRLVVFSSRYLPDNLFVARNATNLDLVLNSVHWLRGRPDLVGIAPKRHVALLLTADPGLRAKLLWLPTLLAIGLLIGLGTAAYRIRRA